MRHSIVETAVALAAFILVMGAWVWAECLKKPDCPDCSHSAEQHNWQCDAEGCCCQTSYRELMERREAMSEELKPCPCGSTDLRVVSYWTRLDLPEEELARHYDSYRRHALECAKCFRRGEGVQRAHQLNAAWNRREEEKQG